MMSRSAKPPAALLLTTAIAGLLTMPGIAFAMQTIEQGHMHDAGKDGEPAQRAHDVGKNAEGCCGTARKIAEGKCGEGQCGGALCGDPELPEASDGASSPVPADVGIPSSNDGA